MGFHNAMRTAPPDSVAAIWALDSRLTPDGVEEIQVPVLSIRISEVGSVILRHCSQVGDDDEEEEVWLD